MDEPKQLPPGPVFPEGSGEVTRDLTRAEIEAQLDARRASMTARLDALQDEVMTTGTSIKAAAARNPFVTVGGAIGVGLVVGLLFGKGRRRQGRGEDAHRALVDRYVQSLMADVRRAVRRGKDVDAALDAALKDRVPLIVYAPEAQQGRSGILRDVFAMALQTALGFALKAAADFLTARLDLTTVEEEVTVEEGLPGEEGHTKATYTRTVSEPSPG